MCFGERMTPSYIQKPTMPNALAFKVISLANSSPPPMASARTTAASFADLVTSPLIASSTLMV
jgi:hypothetical protein